MKHDHFVAQSPDKPARQLLLLFHGVGDNPVAVGEVSSRFVPSLPDVLMVSVDGVEPSDNPAGRQQFSVQGVTEDNRQTRVGVTMPTFIETVRYWWKQNGVEANATTLTGFSQGAIMALESIRAESGLISRVIIFNGCCASLPETVSTATTIHLIHGDEGPVTDLMHTVTAQKTLADADGDVTLDITEDLSHAVSNRNIQLVLGHPRYAIPKHYFDETLSGGKPGDGDAIEMTQQQPGRPSKTVSGIMAGCGVSALSGYLAYFFG